MSGGSKQWAVSLAEITLIVCVTFLIAKCMGCE